MKEIIFKFLYENESTPKNILKHKIMCQFGLSEKKADLIYQSWKEEYMKPKKC